MLASLLSVVAALHRDKSCHFLVNRYHFRRRRITCGIRQGCHLEPLFFIFALDSVDWMLQAREDIRGVPITSGGRTTEFKVSVYADDTAVYLRDWYAIMPVVTILDDFAPGSGLRTNRAKQTVIELDPRGSAQPVSTCSFKNSGLDDSCRYLGVLVGQHDAEADNWNDHLRSLGSRLVLARDSTHKVEIRAQLSSAIAVTKLKLLARPCWPHPPVVTRCTA